MGAGKPTAVTAHCKLHRGIAMRIAKGQAQCVARTCRFFPKSRIRERSIVRGDGIGWFAGGIPRAVDEERQRRRTQDSFANIRIAYDHADGRRRQRPRRFRAPAYTRSSKPAIRLP